MAPELAGGATPWRPSMLTSACRHRNAAVCEILLSSEAPGAYETGIGRPLSYALFFGRARAATITLVCVQLLLHYGTRVDLPWAAAPGHLERIRQFFQDDHRLLPAAPTIPAGRRIRRQACQRDFSPQRGLSNFYYPSSSIAHTST